MSESVNLSFRFDAGPILRATRQFEAAFKKLAATIKRSLPVLVVDDPALERPESLKAWLSQAKAIVLHEFWMAADEPSRSPGARWVRPRR